MATPITVNTITLGGLAPVGEGATDATNGNTVDNNGKTTWIEYTNTHGTVAQTLVVKTPGTIGPAAHPIEDLTINLAVGAKGRRGPFPIDLYGRVLELDSSDTAVTVAAYQI